jgi:cbb3-type cytochrome oxidase subunit 1
MQGVARNFFTLAIGYAIVGMLLGLSMAMSHDHAQMPTHAHIMVLGWIMSSVFAFFYHLVPAAASRLATVHFWLSGISGIVLVAGLFMMIGGNPSIEPVVAVASMAFFVGMLLFAWIALGTMWKSTTVVSPRNAAAS